ncbi:ABC transporter permease [Pelagibacterium halotolerans]|uniref:ABC-type transporter, permease component: POPT family n=1 Tax=Pelagibacterium halotolerans (strain DSM 22347 / JCM 15775 / CGMCC 1.7692 / B2) TaxID=1082931 RepID=G4RCG3_PELHB|nr:ABC transporter permease [Pelagibacterium halotolerans]AEQ53757.1 ABC-type transporter, permease component: POPT family [Pelagibacterium halotolerans B2]QJR20083.1 ABC transporter permease [Pelagibacterium halotolerans]SEA80362.1 putative spermidine/putrescine transport system permease protein [Pelagibacterium halotolerans]
MSKRPFLAWFVSPSVLIAFGIAASFLAIVQYSLRAHVPGSLDPGGFTLDNFTTLLKTIYGQAFLDTALLCVWTALFTLLVGYPLAYALVRAKSARLRSAILLVSLTPLFLGEIVRTYSWIIVLGNQGFLNSTLLQLGIIDEPFSLMFTMTGVVIALVHFTLPIVVVMLAAALSHIDRNLERAATSLGAGRIRVFFTVTLPLSMPGIAAAASTAFAWTFSAFATPQMIGGGQVQTISTLVYQVGFASFNFPLAASLSLSGLAFSILVIALFNAGIRRLERFGAH